LHLAYMHTNSSSSSSSSSSLLSLNIKLHLYHIGLAGPAGFDPTTTGSGGLRFFSKRNSALS
jgi:hypothetical protein